VAALEQSGGKNLALALVKLADCDESDGRYAQAEPLYIRAIKILDSSKTASAEDLSSAVSSLGDLYYSDLDRYAEAETQYRRALSLVQKDSDHAENDLGVAQYRLGSALVAQENKYSEAISLLRSALAIIGRHPDLGEQWHSAATVALANAYWGDSENEKALPLYQSALQLAEKMAPDNPKDLPQRIKDVADCLAQLDRNQEALPLYERALALFKKSAKPDRDDVSAVEQAIASIKDGSTTPAESAATNKSAATTTTTATGSHAAVPKDKDNDGETLEKWLPFVLGLACLILGLLWYRDRKRDPNPPK
jgi:tetratricopeptide (TPR) repeat protein